MIKRITLGGGLAALWACATTLVFAQDRVRLELIEVRSGATLTLTWPSPVKLEITAKERELLLSFDRGFLLHNFDPGLIQKSGWIEGMNTGFDSLLIRASSAVRFRVMQVNSQTIVTLIPHTELPPSPAQKGRLELLKAQLLLETGRLKEAEVLLSQMRRPNEDDFRVLATLAAVQDARGRRREAGRLYDLSLQQEPNNEEVIRARDLIDRENRPELNFIPEFITVADGQTEFRTRTEGSVLLAEGLRIGITFETNETRVNQVRFSNGAIGSFEGGRRRGSLFGQYEARSGAVVRAGLLTDDGSELGGELYYRRPDYKGHFEFFVDYRKPNWDFIEGITNGLRRDRVEVSRLHRFRHGLTAVASLSGNRYRTGPFNSAATSAGFAANMMVRIPERPMQVEYGVDAEYKQSAVTLSDPLGLEFNPLPLVSREIHFVDVSFAKRWNQTCRTNGFAGYSWDRLGGSGPFAGLDLNCEPSRRLASRLFFEQRLNTTQTSQMVIRIGGALRWRF